MTPLNAIPFDGTPSSPEDFFSALPKLSSVLQPKTPIYLLLRRPKPSSSTLVALTYIPSNAPVRPKMLFASTRQTLTRELGTEKFASTVFATEEEEILGRDAWRERDGEITGGVSREDLMDDKERELEAVRKAEAEARSSNRHRDIGIGGTFGPGSGSGSRVSMPVDENAKSALKELQSGGLVQLVCLRPYTPGSSKVARFIAVATKTGQWGMTCFLNSVLIRLCVDCRCSHRDGEACRCSIRR